MRNVHRGRAQFLVDVVAYRAMRLFPNLAGDKTHAMTADGDIRIHYRRNRGDLASIREVFKDEVYRLPEGMAPKTILDMGANIGIASLWFHWAYRPTKIVAFEPSATSWAIARQNFAANRIPGEVVEAAVAPQDGFASFIDTTESNLSRLGTGAATVPTLSPASAIRRMGEPIDLLKIDIEGGEGPLLTDLDPSWLLEFPLILAELHDSNIRPPQMVDIICDLGFDHYSSGDRRPEGKRARLFVRR